MSGETEYRPIPGGETKLPAMLVLEILERIEERTEAAPGRLVRLKVAVRKLARPIPSGFATTDPDPVACILQGRTIEVQEGFLIGAGGHVVAADDEMPHGFFGPGGVIGCPPGGHPLEPQKMFTAIMGALKRKVFTVAEVTRFCEDPHALRALREGALQHIVDSPGGAEALVGVAPGVILGGDEITNKEYVTLHLRNLGVPELLELASGIKKEKAP